MNLEEIVQELEKRLKSYNSEISFALLEPTPYIIEVGALTVSTDINGVVILENRQFPVQFSQCAVNTVLSMTFRNKNNEILKPKVYYRYQWYKEQIEQLKATLIELKKMI
jgi:hypothetical protein